MMHKIIIATLALLVLTGCSSWRWWPWGTKKIDSGFKDPTFDMDHQPGIPKPQTVKPKKKEDTVSVERLEKLAKEGNPNAQLALGKIHFDGRVGKKKNYKKALELFHKAAALGSGPAMFNIGLCYDGGFGVAQSLKDAIAWYEKAADAGVP